MVRDCEAMDKVWAARQAMEVKCNRKKKKKKGRLLITVISGIDE